MFLCFLIVFCYIAPTAETASKYIEWNHGLLFHDSTRCSIPTKKFNFVGIWTDLPRIQIAYIGISSISTKSIIILYWHTLLLELSATIDMRYPQLYKLKSNKELYSTYKVLWNFNDDCAINFQLSLCEIDRIVLNLFWRKVIAGWSHTDNSFN